MKIGITYRLFFAMVATACLSIVCMLLIVRWNTEQGFLRYMQDVDKARMERVARMLVEQYGEHKNWDFLHGDASRFLRDLAVSPYDRAPGATIPQDRTMAQKEAIGQGPERNRIALTEPLAAKLIGRLEAGIVVLDSERTPLYGQTTIPPGVQLKALTHNNRVVGYVGLVPRTTFSDNLRAGFLRYQGLTLLSVSGVVVALAAAFSFFMARRLVRPLKAVASATDRMAAGDFDIRIPSPSSDEVGLLADRFNTLALTLKQNEEARRQLIADVSHELRTPLAVLRGEVEAIRDGVREPSSEQIASLHAEVLRLSRLVDDLHQISLSDLGAMTCRMTEVDLTGLLKKSIGPYEALFRNKAIRLEIDIPETIDAPISGDPERLQQLFSNLLDNSLKYTDAGGTLAVRLEAGNNTVAIDFLDSAPGVATEDLERLFDRLYRQETSRSRKTGGAGLGLAIARSIVEAHGGTIEALVSPLGGVRIRTVLPTKA
jgi:two-component system, OmpR family, sensor histidine kinase BaeS